ncbi:MAG TPA: GvpL/GvpF family gas vesicle protein [Terriglobales bacterium]|nr:GvpL/GvpF family gas vesicle protein [Terriglobales bacterium]
MSARYLYAILGGVPASAPGTGMRGEPLRIVACGGVWAAAGEMDEAPAATAETLRGHDAVVRRLAALTDAVLPARFGALASDDRDLCERITRAPGAVREALARVAGREQMILRVYAAAPANAPVPDVGPRPTGAPPSARAAGDAGPGTRYLTDRAEVRRAAGDVAELAPLRAVFARFVVDERIERHDTPPLVASVYHLVPRGAASDYQVAVEEAARPLRDVRLTVSGPWAAYAFAPEAL